MGGRGDFPPEMPAGSLKKVLKTGGNFPCGPDRNRIDIVKLSQILLAEAYSPAGSTENLPHWEKGTLLYSNHSSLSLT